MTTCNFLLKKLFHCGLTVVIVMTANPVTAKTLFFAQTARGSDTGADLENAHSVTWFNAANSWGSGANQIGVGDTVYLSGIITDGLFVQGDGINLKFTTGSKISLPVGSGDAITNPLHANFLIYCAGRNNVTIDGQGVGVIECTDNGSDRTYQLLVKMIQADDCSNLVVRGLTFKDGYVHTLASDAVLDEGTQGGIKASRMFGTWTIENCTFTNICWAISISQSGISPSTLNIQNNTFKSYDHGIALGMTTAGNRISVNIVNNSFGTTANWDTTSGRYHHDGIHYYGAASNPILLRISGNMFSGDWGIKNTAHIYLETGPDNVFAYNNVFIQWPGNKLNNGFCQIPSNGRIFNNTFLGSGDVVNSIGVMAAGTNMQFVNNIVSGVTSWITSVGQSNTSFSLITNNLYAGQVPGGNSMWRWNLTNYNSMAEWQLAVGERNSMATSDGKLNPDGTLKAGSPAIGSGADFSFIFATDAASVSRSVPWDIGAYCAPKAPTKPLNLRVRASGNSP